MTKIEGKFDGYILRRADFDLDCLQLASWISMDRHHLGIMRPADFLGQMEGPDGELIPDPRPTCYAMEDENGVIFYIRLSRVARVQMQFGPSWSARDRRRNANALIKGMAFIEAALSHVGTEEWIFDSHAPALRTMATRRLGFIESPHELVRPIDPPEQEKPQEGPVEAQQQGTREAS